ncbi:MAG: histidinol-phosphatase [Clostridia bacterium]|nr:histidinol-phosphatase [Clostridia bacterium]
MLKKWNHQDYPYLYDTHVHTSQASACAKNSGADMARAYKEAGYAGIIITDHFYYGNTAVNRNLQWEDWVERFCLGYLDAKQEGAKIGLDVFWGWESGYQGTEFLIYGLDKDWLLMHPEIRDANIRRQRELVEQDGGIVIHAHPYREEDYIREIRLFPEYIHGVECLNACHSNPDSMAHYAPEYDERALRYAREHDFILTAGSDMHQMDLYGGGMAYAEKFKDVDDFVKALYDKKACILTDGSKQYLSTDLYRC